MKRAVMKPFTLLIKPTSADCNLRCSYCFYLPKAALYPEQPRHRMSPEVAERMIASYLATDQPQYVFGWQGGEPTLMGLDFFRLVTELQMRYGKPGAGVSNGLQTNATLITDDFARHLARYNFLVGVSIDGPAELHDHWRKTAAGKGSHAAVLRGMEALRRQGAEFNALVLVNSVNVSHARDVYHYLRDELGLLFQQYIPCVEFDEHGQPLPWT
ncbi:MAG: radical SAM protein, partial [Armatimonadetes bacterium]|nr:radical SAM protein [Armatimonadota bacterium]